MRLRRKSKISPTTAAHARARSVRPQETADTPRYPIMERPLEHMYHDYAKLRRHDASS